MKLQLKVVPKASRNRVVGWVGLRLKIQVTAAPERGKANEAVVEVLADHDDGLAVAVAVCVGKSDVGGEGDVADLKSLEERHIRRVLKLAGGNKSRAARMLGISRRTLYRKKSAR